MPIIAFNLALLFVVQLAAGQLFFRDRENLLHRLFEFVGRRLFALKMCVHSRSLPNWFVGFRRWQFVDEKRCLL